MLYLSLIVLVPLSTLVFKSATLTWQAFKDTVTSPPVVHAYLISFGCSLAAGAVNAVCGLAVAWVLVRYRFLGRRVVDALIDLPFALPTAVAGIALTSLYQADGWLGSLGTWISSWSHIPEKYLTWLNLAYAFTPVGVSLALIFIGLPFVVRTLQPVLEDLGVDIEEAAASLGATRWQTFRRVIFPELWPAVLTGFALSVARALGEYGSVVFISGNLPMKTEIAPNQIIQKLEQYNYAGATAIALVMLVASLVLLLLISLVERLTVRRVAH
jgi:sulfate transport system permease protein